MKVTLRWLAASILLSLMIIVSEFRPMPSHCDNPIASRIIQPAAALQSTGSFKRRYVSQARIYALVRLVPVAVAIARLLARFMCGALCTWPTLIYRTYRHGKLRETPLQLPAGRDWPNYGNYTTLLRLSIIALFALPLLRHVLLSAFSGCALFS